MSKGTRAALICIAVFVVLVMPYSIVWALNELFPALDIPQTWRTYLATLVLWGALTGGARTKE